MDTHSNVIKLCIFVNLAQPPSQLNEENTTDQSTSNQNWRYVLPNVC